MKTLLVPAAAAALLALAPMAALAKTSTNFSDAVIKSINPSARTVTLADGNTYGLNYAGLVGQLQPGAHVNLHVQDVNGANVVTSVTRAS